MRSYPAILALMLLIAPAYAQEQLSRRQQADRLFERYEYSKSLELYLPLAGRPHTDVELIERIAACYWYMNKYSEAETWYGRATAGPHADIKATYLYAEALLANQKFADARSQFTKYYTAMGDQETLGAKLASIDSALAWIKQPTGYKISNVKQLNSAGSDWGLSYYGKTGSVFVSDRNTATGVYKRTGNGWIKPYLASVEEKPLGEFDIQLHDGRHVGPVCFNAGGDTAYITVTALVEARKIPVQKGALQDLYTRRLEILIIAQSAGKWKIVQGFPYNNIKEHSVGHAALSQNGKTLYFTSDMPGGKGGTDIWYCEKLADGTWGKPVNCGNAVNTPDDEAFPGTASGGISFSSKGLLGMGGYDIFYARGEKNAFEKPQNLKFPVNSTTDDFCFTTRDGLNGYLSSDRAGGEGSDDIYRFSFTMPVPALVAKSVPPGPGPLPPGGRLEPGRTYILKNIYYDLDKADIRPDAVIELDKLFRILQQNPGIRIELSSHTDSRASAAYNMELSQRRAEAAVAYLVKKGISKERLQARGYGESRLLNRCSGGIECTEAEHQANRRTEVRVLEE